MMNKNSIYLEYSQLPRLFNVKQHKAHQPITHNLICETHDEKRLSKLIASYGFMCIYLRPYRVVDLAYLW